MEVLSLAWRTDLALLEQSGSTVDHYPTCVVVRTPQNPTFRWGNLLLLRRRPMRHDLPGVLVRFDELLPGLAHRAIGIDDPEAGPEDAEVMRRAGLIARLDVVLTATSLLPPRHPNRAATVRQLDGEADWRQKVALDLACSEDQPAVLEPFATRRAAAERRAAEEGHGAWFGAFDGGRLLAGLGIFRAGDALARFQTVQTHPEARGRGLAGTLLHRAGAHATEHLGADRLVLVADPDYHALRLYLAAGFTQTETQLGAEMAIPGRASPSAQDSSQAVNARES